MEAGRAANNQDRPLKLLHHQFARHVVVMRSANDTAGYFVFTFGRGREKDPSRAAGLDRLFDAQRRDVKTVLHVRSRDRKLNRLS